MNKEEILSTQPENLSGTAGLGKLYKFRNFYFAGHQTPETLKELAKIGVQKVLDLKNPGEVPIDDEAAAQEAGLQYHNFPISGPHSLGREQIEEIEKVIDHQTPTLVYCMSGNRVGMWFAAHLFTAHQFSAEEAVEKAIAAGMDKPGMGENTKLLLESY